MTGGLIDVDDSVLIAIDVQEPFLAKLPTDAAASLVARISWLLRVAQQLGVPIVTTAEDIDRLGPPVSAILAHGLTVHDKLVFGLAADGEILAAIGQTQRWTAILVGLETDVCVAHSAIGLLERGYRVAVLADGCGSPEHVAGLRRVEAAGALVMPIRSLFYEWLRTVEATRLFRQQMGPSGAPPSDIVL